MIVLAWIDGQSERRRIITLERLVYKIIQQRYQQIAVKKEII
jgi:hypothetical protein